MNKQLEKSDEEWRDQLTPDQYNVCRCGGTEAPFTGEYWDCKTDGTYLCAACETPLFTSDTKYDSGSVAGLASGKAFLLKPFVKKPTPPTVWFAQKFCVHHVIAI